MAATERARSQRRSLALADVHRGEPGRWLVRAVRGRDLGAVHVQPHGAVAEPRLEDTRWNPLFALLTTPDRHVDLDAYDEHHHEIAIVPGKPEESDFHTLMVTKDDRRMPPRDKGEAVPAHVDTGFYWYDKTNITDPKISAVLYD